MRRLLFSALLFVCMAVPAAPVAAQTGIIGLGLPFGGRVVSAIPCVSNAGPGFWVTLVPFGPFPVTYIWTPLTKTHLMGPPRTPGQYVLGKYDIPAVCFVGKIPLVGMRMSLVGTSIF